MLKYTSSESKDLIKVLGFREFLDDSEVLL